MKRLTKCLVAIMLLSVALVGLFIVWPHKTRAASAATLDTVYQYKIVNERSGLVLGISAPFLKAGSTARQWIDNGQPDHLWHFIPAGSGYYKILNMHSGEILGVSGASTSVGASVLQWADNGTNDHLWEFISNGSGAYEILNENSGLVLDVAGAATTPGAGIVQAAYTGASDQLWKLVSMGVPAYPNPGYVTGNVTVHDPSMVRTASGTYYLFSTSLAEPRDGIEVHTSPDRIHFSNAVPVFNTFPSWIGTYNGGTHDMWAPDVSYHNGKYWLYYAVSSFGSQVSAIGLATSTSAAPGSWIDQGPVFTSSAGSPYNAIDPGLIVDAAGNWWLSFGSWWNGIYMIQLDPSTGKQLSSNPTVYHLAKRLDISKGLEGAYIYHYGRYYYLFASIDTCCSPSATYHIIVGRSTSVTGPYIDEGGVNMLDGGGTVILSAHGNIVGPGGQTVMTDRDGSLLVYHYYDSNNNGSPTLGLNLLGWSPTGWPYVR
jgi:arabinan endo-1,5-alpha-L-arabinosidase